MLSRSTLLTAYVCIVHIIHVQYIFPPHLSAEIRLPGCGSGFVDSSEIDMFCSWSSGLAVDQGTRLFPGRIESCSKVATYILGITTSVCGWH